MLYLCRRKRKKIRKNRIRKYSTLKGNEGRFPRELHISLSALGPHCPPQDSTDLYSGEEFNFQYSCYALLSLLGTIQKYSLQQAPNGTCPKVQYWRGKQVLFI